jgi:putative photosynthetic complex assembly protein
MHPLSTDPFPRAPLIGAAALLGVVLTAAVVGHLTGAGRPQPVSGVALAMADLRFDDQPDGAITVRAEPGERLIATVPPATNGFLRGTLRGMARERRRDDGTPAAPFRLTAWNDGRLTLDDPQTGRRVDLEAFGATNEAAFARFLSFPQERAH